MDILLSVDKRALTGESIFMSHFTNTGVGKKRAALAARYPVKIILIDVGETGGELICQKDAFLCFAKGASIGIALQKRVGTGFFGGGGAFLATLTGQGRVLLQSLPSSRLADRIIKHAPSKGGRNQGEGSVLGGLGNILMGEN
jgi:uncharacterized protein (AIM24 family)